MKTKKVIHGLMFAIAFVVVFSLSSCSKTPSGSRYKSSNDDFSSAETIFNSAMYNNGALENCEYEAAFIANVPSLNFDIGVSNFFQIKNKNAADNTEIYSSATYYSFEYGSSGYYQTSDESSHYLKNGEIYLTAYNTNYKAPCTPDEFVSYTQSKDYYNNLDFFNPSRFSSATTYNLFGKKTEIVFNGADEELIDMISDFFLFGDTDYVYSVDDVTMMVSINKNNLVTEISLTFKIPFKENFTSTNEIIYLGNFGYKLTDSDGNLESKIPANSGSRETLSSVLAIDGLITGFDVLGDLIDLDATYNRHLIINVNSLDNPGYFESENQVRFTQAFRNGRYTYGSIDYETIKILTSSSGTKNSVGIFVDENGKYYLRDTEGNSEDKDADVITEMERWYMVYETLASERIMASDVTNVKITENEEYVTYTYQLNTATVLEYGQYLYGLQYQEVLSKAVLTSVAMTYTNSGKIIVRKSDGCIVSQSFSFKVLFNSSVLKGTVAIESKFEMTVNSTENIDVLTLDNWEDWLDEWNR